MKVVAIGDIHGRTTWKDIVNSNTDADKFVFIGDYFDTHEDVSGQQQIENFKDIIKYKSDNLDKVVLLTGNHDFHYLKGVNEKYSGYQQWQQFDIQILLHAAIDMDFIKMCFIHDKYLFTHAGVSKTWAKKILGNGDIKLDGGNMLEKIINDTFKYQPNLFRFTHGITGDMYGDEICQTPIWIRPKSLKKDRLENFIHVVGHTTQDYIKQDESGIILIDTLGTSGQYLIINDSEIKVETVN